jgi:outer membrane protein assembly factor BamC
MSLRLNALNPALAAHTAIALALAALALAGCETTTSIGKKIDYKSVSSTPSLELPPDLKSPQYDDRYNVSTASGLAARDATKPKTGEQIAPNQIADAKIIKAGNERWLQVRATPEQAWNITRQFWLDNGFVLAKELPGSGVMETDWAENRAEIPPDFLRSTIGKYADLFYTTYKREKFHSRVERGSEAGTVDIYVASRVMEQVPTTKIDNSSPAAFAWAVLPPNPGLDAEWLGRLMVRFGVPETQANESVRTAGPGGANTPDRAQLQKAADGVNQLVVDDTFDRAWRRVGLALDRIGFTVVDRDRSKGQYFVRYSDPETAAKDEGILNKLMFWKSKDEKPEQYRITVAQADPRSVVTVQDPTGTPDKTGTGEKILALLKDQLK